MEKIKRRLPAYNPDFDHDVAGWVIKTIQRNYWRVAGSYEFEDLVQDARLYFHILCQKYPLVHQHRHMFALFKTTFSNHITDLAKATTLFGGKGVDCIYRPYDGAVAPWKVDLVPDDPRADLPEDDVPTSSLLPQELACLINECKGDARLLALNLGWTKDQIDRAMQSMGAKLRKSVTTTIPKRVYLVETS